ncbi:MFS transporter [Seohaeicola zhoushanensis]
MLVAMNVAYALSAYPVGALSDRLSRPLLLAGGLALLILADLILALMPGLWGAGLGVLVWGLHMGATQGLVAAMVADAAPADLRGTAFGLYNLVSGIALLLASLTAGVLWETVGASATFLCGAAFAALSLLGAILLRRQAAARQKSVKRLDIL